MTTKEKVVRESIKRLKKKLQKVEDLLNATPILDLIEVHKEAQILLDENPTVKLRCSEEFLNKMHVLANREKQALALAKKQNNNTIKLMDQQSEIKWELNDLDNELWYITRDKK